MNELPRNEYPRPQFVREDWLCLNGKWGFEIDNSESGEARKFFDRDSLDGEINVPFCPESKLSGVENKDFMNAVWYMKKITVPDEWAGKRVLIHFGAVDYKAHLWVNGRDAGTHEGGYVPFDADITEYLVKGENKLVLEAVDHLRDGNQPAGKQCVKYYSESCSYTRTTGIWQSVWLEPVSDKYVKSFKAYPDIGTPSVTLSFSLEGDCVGSTLTVKALYDGRPVGEAGTVVYGNSARVTVPLSEKHLWDVGQGELYDLEFTLTADGEEADKVKAYFGLREIALDKRGMRLNGRYVFGRFVLDQGFYPDGIYTAPTDKALEEDVTKSMELGFNGARLHQKIFEPRFLYHADRHGYMVWGGHANWGLRHDLPTAIDHFLPEWLEILERDFSHPSVIGWCPFNETWDLDGHKQHDPLLRLVYLATKAADSTRPVIDVSGNFHVETDIYDIHDYMHDVGTFKAIYEKIDDGIVEDQAVRMDRYRDRQSYDGKKPIFLSEYGGIGWASNDSGWGYGSSVEGEEGFKARYKGLTDAILDNPHFMGFCYTQLYDIEQEQNGLMTYSRKFKFDPAFFKEVNSRKAAMEDQNYS